jgi:hypothetical protein
MTANENLWPWACFGAAASAAGPSVATATLALSGTTAAAGADRSCLHPPVLSSTRPIPKTANEDFHGTDFDWRALMADT